MYKHIQKALDWGVKIASLAITAPATWVVATQLFSDIQSATLLFIMRFAAVFLIEGVLLSNWLLLEFDKKASPGIKARYGITALVIYAALAVIGWQHEGPTGLVFRVALLAALIGSGWDTYVYTWQQMTSNIDRSAVNAGRVKRHARKLSIKEAILRREAGHAAELAFIEAEGTAARVENNLLGERLLQEIELDDKEQRLKLDRQEQHLLNRNGNGTRSSGSSGSRETDDEKKSDPAGLTDNREENSDSSNGSSAGSEEIDDRLLTLSILDAFEDDPRLSRTALSQKMGVSRRRVFDRVKKMIRDGLLVRDGRAHYVTEDGENLVTHGSLRAAVPYGRR